MRECDSFIAALGDDFDLSVEGMRRIVADFHEEMEAGLCGQKSSLKMLPAFIDRASGRERGRYIALDFGGTNFRVLDVRLLGDGRVKVQSSGRYVIPSAVSRGTGDQLFNFIAQSISRFLDANGIDPSDSSALGFTFSFPMKQSSIAAGVLMNWTKGFSASGVVNSDVVKLLERALAKFALENIRIAALANDTVGTLEAKSYEEPGCDVGIIFGTGTNACYRERVERIRKQSFAGYKAGHMIVNIEWGNFDRIPMTDYDAKLDRATNNPGKQRMEKMISGMYLGEIARLVISDMIRRKLVFAKSRARLPKGNFKTRHMSLIESDRSSGLMKVEGYLEGIGVMDTFAEEREALKKVCRIVSRRAARISAAAISAVVTRMDPGLKSRHSIAIDGTLYEKYPGFRRSILAALKELHGQSASRINLVSARDGSGIGVAVAAAVAVGAGSR